MLEPSFISYIEMKGVLYNAIGKKVKQLMTKTMDLPQDVMMDLPRITMIGQLHIYIENHRGLLAFTDSEVRLMLKNGQLLIKEMPLS